MQHNKPPRFLPYRTEILIVLWGLLFTKCFVFEYLVSVYSVPVNSILYIWAPSIVMATVATLVFLRIQSEGRTAGMATSLTAGKWGGIGVAALLILFIGLYSNLILPARIPAYFALLMGLGYGLQGARTKDLLDWLPALGWWVGGITIFQSASVVGLLIFAVCIVLFSVLPTLLRILRGVRKGRMTSGVEK